LDSAAQFLRLSTRQARAMSWISRAAGPPEPGSETRAAPGHAAENQISRYQDDTRLLDAGRVKVMEARGEVLKQRLQCLSCKDGHKAL